jgi:hypothetical protein
MGNAVPLLLFICTWRPAKVCNSDAACRHSHLWCNRCGSLTFIMMHLYLRVIKLISIDKCNDKIFNLLLSLTTKQVPFIHHHHMSVWTHLEVILPWISDTYTTIPMTSTKTNDRYWCNSAWTVNYMILNIGIWDIPAKMDSSWSYTSSISIKVRGHWAI